MNPIPPPMATIAMTTMAIIRPILEPSSSVTSGDGTGVGVFTGVLVGSGAVITGIDVATGFGVTVGGTAVGGTAVATVGLGVAVAGMVVGGTAVGAVCGVAVAGTAVAAAGLGVEVGGTAVATTGLGVAVAGAAVATTGLGVAVGFGASPIEKLPSNFSTLTSYVPTGLSILNVMVAELFALTEIKFDVSMVPSNQRLAGYIALSEVRLVTLAVIVTCCPSVGIRGLIFKSEISNVFSLIVVLPVTAIVENPGKTAE